MIPINFYIWQSFLLSTLTINFFLLSDTTYFFLFRTQLFYSSFNVSSSINFLLDFNPLKNVDSPCGQFFNSVRAFSYFSPNAWRFFFHWFFILSAYVYYLQCYSPTSFLRYFFLDIAFFTSSFSNDEPPFLVSTHSSSHPFTAPSLKCLDTLLITCLHSTILEMSQQIWRSNVNLIHYFTPCHFFCLHFIRQALNFFFQYVSFSLHYLFRSNLYLPPITHVKTHQRLLSHIV